MFGLHNHGVDSVTVINFSDTQMSIMGWSCLMFNKYCTYQSYGINSITVLIIP